MDKWTSKIGRFKVADQFFRRLSPDEGTNLFHRMVVLDVRRDFLTNEREYLAIHPDFRPLRDGEIAPKYDAIFQKGSTFPTWAEKK